jgi:hypothetical protein
MRFYTLNMSPRGDADTCAEEEEGHNRGDAALCPRCGSAVGMLAWLPPLRVVLKLYGKEFGDFAFMGARDDFLASQKFRETYFQHRLTGLVGFDPVDVIGVKSRRKNLSAPPKYFRVCAPYGKTALDLRASGAAWLEQPTCPLCWTATIVRWKRLVVDEATWTGEDAFRPRGMAGQTMVSQRFKDACDQHGIKNAIFTPAEISGHDFYPWLTDPSDVKMLP